MKYQIKLKKFNNKLKKIPKIKNDSLFIVLKKKKKYVFY